MDRGGAMKYLSLLGVAFLLVGAVACSWSKAKPLVPLALEPGVKAQAVALTEQGTQAYQARQFDDAKNYFSQALPRFLSRGRRTITMPWPCMP